MVLPARSPAGSRNCHQSAGRGEDSREGVRILAGVPETGGTASVEAEASSPTGRGFATEAVPERRGKEEESMGRNRHFIGAWKGKRTLQGMPLFRGGWSEVVPRLTVRRDQATFGARSLDGAMGQSSSAHCGEKGT
jgi:hypothetical protein